MDENSGPDAVAVNESKAASGAVESRRPVLSAIARELPRAVCDKRGQAAVLCGQVREAMPSGASSIMFRFGSVWVAPSGMRLD